MIQAISRIVTSEIERGSTELEPVVRIPLVFVVKVYIRGRLPDLLRFRKSDVGRLRHFALPDACVAATTFPTICNSGTHMT